MKDESNHADRTQEISDIAELPLEMKPPPELEAKVVRALETRGLLEPDRSRTRRGVHLVRGGLAVAASLLLVMAGFLLGRATAPGGSSPGASGAPAPTLYALSLFETRDFRPPTGRESLIRYQEYSRWVAEARRRKQFVGGEDLDVDGGWVIRQDGEGAAVEPGAKPEEGATLSGIFFISAADERQALELARRLPHLQHGGQVVVQQVMPTDRPPRVE